MFMFTVQANAKETVKVPTRCKCGATMKKAVQAPSYCGNYFYSDCTRFTWRDSDNHTMFEHYGHIDDFDVVYTD
jgi:hypothetical protein